MDEFEMMKAGWAAEDAARELQQVFDGYERRIAQLESERERIFDALGAIFELIESDAKLATRAKISRSPLGIKTPMEKAREAARGRQDTGEGL